MFKIFSFTLVFTLLATSNWAFASASAKGQAEIRIGSGCGSNQICIRQLHVALGYFLGTYQEPEGLNEISCQAVIPGKADRIACRLSKFVSESKDHCYHQSNEIVLDFYTVSGHPNLITVPKIESQTGYQYSCEN